MPSTLPAFPDSPFPAPVQPGGARIAPAGPAPGAQGAAPPSEPLRLLGALFRHRWIVLGVTAAGVAAGVGAARLVKPQYAAQGTVWIEAGGRENPAAGPIRSGGLLESYAWVELLKSYAVLDPVVRERRLYVAPASPADARLLEGMAEQGSVVPGGYRFTAGADGARWSLARDDGTVLQRGARGAVAGAPAGIAWVPPAAALAPGRVTGFTLRNPRDVARELGDAVEASMADDGHFLRLTLQGGDPARITATLNTLMERYVEVAAQLKRAKLDQLTGILQEQRDYAEANLRDSEAALEGFRVRTVTLPSDRATPVAPGLQITRDPVFAGYFDMRVRRDDLMRDRDALERVLAAARTGEGSLDALAVIPSVQASPDLARMLADRTARRAELRALRERYTDEAPAVRRLAGELATLETSAIPQAVAQLQASLDGGRAELDSRIASASGELRQIPARAIEEARLKRRVDIAEALYGTLRQRYEEARLAAVSSIPDLRVLDRAAVPTAPVQDRRPLVILLFAGAGLALALAIVLVLDRADRRVRYASQVTGMGLPVLAAIPQTRGALASRDPRGAAQLGEAFRELRLAVSHAHGGAGPLVLTVTSAMSGDGKSTVASGLAAAFAGQGQRTLLIDGDVRRGVLHRNLGLARTPGLIDLLNGTAGLGDVLRPVGSYWVIPSGARLKTGPELIGSPAMAALLAEVKPRFQVVIVDSPPLGAGVDAYVLGTLTGAMLMVVRTGATDGELAGAKLDLLDRLPVRVLGAVLNAVPPTRLYRGYSYLPGYEVQDEPGAALPASTPG
ncbi:MAG TPA: GNVR domain-containing protein [Longimicrobium sp.]|nr:GNVR domain-containing protein [Longimicrobium sp.]